MGRTKKKIKANKRDIKAVFLKLKRKHGVNATGLKKHELVAVLNKHFGGSWTDLLNPITLGKRVIQAVRGEIKLPPPIRKFLEEKGNRAIVGLIICREPLGKAIQKALDLLSLGNFSKNAKDIGYDDIYHLFMIVYLDDGSAFRLEKNETIMVKPFHNGDSMGKDQFEVDLHGEYFSVASMFKFGEEYQGHDRFIQYSPTKANCQMFVLACLGGQDRLNKDIEKFVFQDPAGLVKSTFVSVMGDTITNLASRFQILKHGAGFEFGGVLPQTGDFEAFDPYPDLPPIGDDNPFFWRSGERKVYEERPSERKKKAKREQKARRLPVFKYKRPRVIQTEEEPPNLKDFFGDGFKFNKLANKVKRSYEKKGYSRKEASYIGKATAGKVFRRKKR